MEKRMLPVSFFQFLLNKVSYSKGFSLIHMPDLQNISNLKPGNPPFLKNKIKYCFISMMHLLSLLAFPFFFFSSLSLRKFTSALLQSCLYVHLGGLTKVTGNWFLEQTGERTQQWSGGCCNLQLELNNLQAVPKCLIQDRILLRHFRDKPVWTQDRSCLRMRCCAAQQLPVLS